MRSKKSWAGNTECQTWTRMNWRRSWTLWATTFCWTMTQASLTTPSPHPPFPPASRAENPRGRKTEFCLTNSYFRKFPPSEKTNRNSNDNNNNDDKNEQRRRRRQQQQPSLQQQRRRRIRTTRQAEIPYAAY